jgi:hypothetical protein
VPEARQRLWERLRPSVDEAVDLVDADLWKGQAFCLTGFLMVHQVVEQVQADVAAVALGLLEHFAAVAWGLLEHFAAMAWGLLEHFASVAFEIPQDDWLPVGRSIQWLRGVPSRVPPVLVERLV